LNKRSGTTCGGSGTVNKWQAMTLGRFAPLTYGKNLPDKVRRRDGKVPVYGSNGQVGWHDTALTNGPTIIVGRKGTIGSAHYSPSPCWPIDTTFFVTECADRDIRFTYYLLQSLGLEGMNSDSAVPGLNRENAHALAVRIPSLPEQRAIASILGALDDKIELNRRMNETLETIARALFTSWFVDFDPVRAKMEGRQPVGMDAEIAALLPEGLEESEIGAIPVGWQIAPFSSLATLSRVTINPSNYPSEVFDHYSLPAFDQGQIPASDQGNTIKSQKFVVPGSSLLLSKLNPRFPRAWIPTVSPLRRAIASTEFLVLLPHHETPREYLYSLYLSSGFMEDFASRVTGTSGSHQRVKPEDLLSMVVVLPPGPLRRAFNDRTGPLLRRVSANRQESLTLATIRDTLLPKLLSGEVRVQEAERELEAVL